MVWKRNLGIDNIVLSLVQCTFHSPRTPATDRAGRFLGKWCSSMRTDDGQARAGNGFQHQLDGFDVLLRPQAPHMHQQRTVLTAGHGFLHHQTRAKGARSTQTEQNPANEITKLNCPHYRHPPPPKNISISRRSATGATRYVALGVSALRWKALVLNLGLRYQGYTLHTELVTGPHSTATRDVAAKPVAQKRGSSPSCLRSGRKG